MFEQTLDLLKQAEVILNEGIRGGRVIGHTKAGAPIYEKTGVGKLPKRIMIKTTNIIVNKLKNESKHDIKSIAYHVNLECARTGIYESKYKRYIALEVLKRVR